MDEITVNEPAARAWLADQASAVLNGEPYAVDIEAHWQPGDADQTSTCIALIYHVQTAAAEIVQSLNGRRIDLVFEDDDEGGTYLVSVDFPPRYEGTSRITVADQHRIERDNLRRESLGPDGAVALLREAVAAANRMSATLSRYTRSYVLVVRDPDARNQYKIDGDVIAVDIDLGYACDGTPYDEDDALNFVDALHANLGDIPHESTHSRLGAEHLRHGRDRLRERERRRASIPGHS